MYFIILIDEDLNSSMSSGIYACTPSLMALQQMRNRLHMAYLGKRLMKWTVLATSRDLRRIALDISHVYSTLMIDIQEAHMKLARCRYFHSQINIMAVENYPNQARLTVSQIMKTMAGCKYKNFEVVDCGERIYPHLGIEKGGQVIRETKDIWFELTKKLINISSLRISFQYLDAYTKAATKKMNVLAKVVIPKTLNTIKYIILELEERAREDFFRLKKVVDLKRRIRAKREKELKGKCLICSAVLEGETVTKKCVCLITGEGPCEIKEMPICYEEPEEEMVEPENVEPVELTELAISTESVIPIETVTSAANVTQPVESIGPVGPLRHVELPKPPKPTESSKSTESQPKEGTCEGYCVGKAKDKKKLTMPILDDKRHYTVDEDDAACEGSCTGKTNENKNRPNMPVIDSKRHFHVDEDDAICEGICTGETNKNNERSDMPIIDGKRHFDVDEDDFCEGSRTLETDRNKKSLEMPKIDSKTHFDTSKTDAICEGPCAKATKSEPEYKSETMTRAQIKNTYSDVKIKKVTIDPKTDVKAIDNVDMPSCSCFQSKNTGSDTSSEIDPGESKQILYAESYNTQPKFASKSIEDHKTTRDSECPLDTNVKRYTKVRRFEDADGRIREERITITIQKDNYDAPSDVEDALSNHSETDDEDYINYINYCISTDQSSSFNTPRILKYIKSEPATKQTSCHHNTRCSQSLSDICHKNVISDDSSAIEFTYLVTKVFEYEEPDDNINSP